MRITVEILGQGFQAYKDGDKRQWEYGESIIEVIQKLIKSFPELESETEAIYKFSEKLQHKDHKIDLNNLNNINYL